MATFQISYTGPGEAEHGSCCDANAASTSYLHLSGHTRPQQRQESRFGRLDDEDGGGAADEVQDTDGDEMMGDGFGGGDAGHGRLATTGQAIASSATFMRGHGAYIASPASTMLTDDVNAKETAPIIRSSLCGIVRRTNKLISVSSLKTRYAPEVGDLVIGRITDLQPGNRRWKVDIQSRQEANLLLSSINLPGGIQRRKLESDELEMRTFFKEGDLLVCEVQSIFHDGSTSLHTRSLNYGKLRNGQLATVNPCLVRRLKSHFVRLEHTGLEILIGLNGVLWVSILNQGKVNVTTGTGRDVEAIYSDVNDVVPTLMRQRIGRMLKIIALLAKQHLPVSDVILSQAYDASVNLAPIGTDVAEEATFGGDEHAEQLSHEVCEVVLDHVRHLINEAV